MSAAAPSAPEAPFPVLASRPHYAGRIISVRTDAVRMPDGTVADRDIVAHPGAVGVLALDEADQVVVVRQYRAPVGQWLDELPAGVLDVDAESALAGAQRELAEEAGLRADQWHTLVDLHTSPGMTDEAIRMYLATGLSDVPAAERYHAVGDEEATMTVRRVPLDRLVDAALGGQLTNAAAVAAVLAAARARAEGWAGLRGPDVPWPARPGR